MSLNRRFSQLAARPYLAELLALLAAAAYGLQSWLYAHSQYSVLDEGAYLVKGYLFVTGRYAPYQDFGPWTNHMPLSFLIPGVVQALFGPGLRAGRYFAILIGLLYLLGLWLLLRRLGGRWWAALGVLAVALNPAVVKMYSVAVSQGLAAMLLAWVLVLGLGREKPGWQVYAGAGLAGVLALTRINLTAVLLFYILYILWQHGWRAGLLAGLAGGGVVLLGHLAFWPEILKMWAYWLPEGLLPFLDTWARPENADPTWLSDISLQGRFNSFWWAIRYHFVPVTAVLSVWLLWPRRAGWTSAARFRMALFLSLLYALLFGLHFAATIAGTFCVFCLQSYLAFFDVLGLALLALSLPVWRERLPGWRRVLVLAFILLYAALLGYGAYQVIGGALVTPRFVRQLLFAQLPRFNASGLQPGRIELWGLLENLTGLDYNALFATLEAGLMYVVSVLAGLLAAALVLLLARQRRRFGLALGLAPAALLFLLALGLLLSPSRALGGGYRDYDCGGDVLSSYEAAGAALAAHIPLGASLYWDGGKSAVPLLYLPGREIYPAQLNGDYSFRDGGDPAEVERYGFWNATLQAQWLAEADYLLLEARVLSEYNLGDEWSEIAVSPPTVACRGDAAIHVFQRSD